MEPLANSDVRQLVQLALREDIGTGDVTTLATVPDSATARACIVARERLVVAGLALAEAAFLELCPSLDLRPLLRDGAPAQLGDALLQIEGSTRPSLTAERVALNFLQ